MLEWIEIFGRAAGHWAIAMILWTGALLVVVRLFEHALRRHVGAGWRVALYTALPLRLALPVDWHSPMLRWDPVGTRVPVVVGESPLGLAAPDAPALIGLREVGELSSSSSSLAMGWGSALALTWLLVAMLLAMRWLAAHRQLRRMCAEAIPARLGSLRVRVHERCGPLACGIVSPTILLPRWAMQRLDAAQIDRILAHEHAHLRRGDPVLLTLMGATLIVLWPIVPLWLAARRVRALAEHAADARAVATLGDDWRAYARTMLDLSQHDAGLPPPAPALGGFADLRARIVALRERPRLPRSMQALAIAGSIVAVLACAGLPTDASTRCEQLASELAEAPPEAWAERWDRTAALADALAQAQASAPGASSACRIQTRDALVAFATQAHDAAEANHEESVRELAALGYARFAASFPDDPDAYTLSYYAAELSWARAVHREGQAPGHGSELFARAHDEFVAVLQREPTGRWASDAAYAQMLAARNAHGPLDDDLQIEGGGDRTDRKVTDPPRAYEDGAAVLARAYDRYLDHTGSGGLDWAQAVHARATLAMRHNRFDEAHGLLVDALPDLDTVPEARAFAIGCAEMLADVLVIAWTRSDLDDAQRLAAQADLKSWLDRFPALALWSDPGAARLREATNVLQAGIAWKRALRYEAAGDYDACAAAFEALIAAHPDHPRVDDMRANAAKCRAAERPPTR